MNLVARSSARMVSKLLGIFAWATSLVRCSRSVGFLTVSFALVVKRVSTWSLKRLSLVYEVSMEVDMSFPHVLDHDLSIHERKSFSKQILYMDARRKIEFRFDVSRGFEFFCFGMRKKSYSQKIEIIFAQPYNED
jgi:hypothetical protein